jgi:hypothetical protein
MRMRSHDAQTRAAQAVLAGSRRSGLPVEGGARHIKRSSSLKPLTDARRFGM